MIKAWLKTMAKKITTKFIKPTVREIPPSRFPAAETHFHNDSGQPKITSLRDKVASISNNAILIQDRIEIDGVKQRILMKDSSDVNRILLDSENGLFKLSQAGNDVLTAADDKLVWSSEFNAFKIVKTDTSSINIISEASGGTATVTIAHNLGFTPALLAYIENSAGKRESIPYHSYVFACGGGTCNLNLSWIVKGKVDSTNVIFTSQNQGTSTTTRAIRYYLLRETAS